MSNMPFTSRNILLLLVFLFLFTRLYNLTLLPIFTDEAIYIYWAKYIASYHSNWFTSLTDGKPPLFIWIIAAFLKMFPPSAYLFAGRFVSVIAGGLAIIGIYKLSLLLFRSNKTSFIAALLYILSPFMLFYDRMALFDSFLSAALVWSVYFAIKTSISHKKKDAILWGTLLGIALLVKLPAIIFLFITPICFLILLSKKDFKKLLLLPLLAIAIALAISGMQKLSANYQLLNAKNQQFQLSFDQLLLNPFILLEKNLRDIFDWIISYYTMPVLILGGIGMIFLLYKDFRKGALLFILWAMPIVIFATVGKILFPRYILFTTPYFIILLAEASRVLFSYNYIKRLQIPIVLLALFASLKFDFYLLANPPLAPLPITDYNQYISSEYSGYGLDKVFSFLDTEVSQGPQIMLVTQGKFGLFPYAFKLKYWDDKRMMFYQAWLSEKLDVDVYPLQKSARVYIVLWQNEQIPKSFPFREVLKAEKPGGKHPILLAVPIEKHE